MLRGVAGSWIFGRCRCGAVNDAKDRFLFPAYHYESK